MRGDHYCMNVEKGRFLRNVDLRAELYEAGQGRCQNPACGKPLETGWHADHIVPYVETKRTNVFEMQALCPTCNTKKGSKMTNNELIDFSKLRPGQKGAINHILDRVRAGQRAISIVLPPGYGKSDVIRVSATLLMLQKHVSRALVLVPAETLRRRS